MTMTFEEFVQDLLNRIDQAQRLVIAIDGFGGSGKTTFASALQKHIPSVGIVSVDHFLQPIVEGGDDEFHWERFEQEALNPLRNGGEIRYAPYDWKQKAFQDEIVIDENQHVIVEGVYSTQEKFRDAYAVKIWVDAPDEIRLERGIARDGESMRQMWEDVWLPFQCDYKSKHTPHLLVDIVIDGAASDFGKGEIVVKELGEE